VWYGMTRKVASSGYSRQRARRRDANEEYKNGKHKEVIRETFDLGRPQGKGINLRALNKKREREKKGRIIVGKGRDVKEGCEQTLCYS
jgi:hypothetical protein